MSTELLIEIVNMGRGTPEIFEELMLRDVDGIDELMLGEIGGKKFSTPQKVFQVNEKALSKYDRDERSPIEGFLYDLRENNPDIYGKYREPAQIFPMADRKANGGRIGFQGGGMDASQSDYKSPGSGSYSRSYNPGAGGVVQHGGGGNKNVNKGGNNNQNVSNICLMYFWKTTIIWKLNVLVVLDLSFD